MTFKQVVEFYETEGKRLSRKKLKIRLRELGFKEIGAGDFTTVFAKKWGRFVIKISDYLTLQRPKQKGSRIAKHFIDYTYLSLNKKFGIQPKVREVRYRSSGNQIYNKFKADGTYYRYDIHGANIGKYKGKWRLIDF